jgi:hypothetical protein
VSGEKGRYYGSHPRAFVLDTRHLDELGADALGVLDEVLRERGRGPSTKEAT